MNKCKDCFHFEVCAAAQNADSDDVYTALAAICEHYIETSRVITLPIVKEYLSDKQIDEIDYRMLANSIIAKAKRREQFVDKLYYAVCEQIYDMAKKKEEDYEDSIQAKFDKNKK